MQTLLPLSDVDSLRWLAVVLDAAAKSLVLVALAGGAALLLRRSSAAVRHMVWMLAVIGLLCLPVLSVVLPQWQVPVLPAWVRMAERTPAQPPVPLVKNQPPAVAPVPDAPPSFPRAMFDDPSTPMEHSLPPVPSVVRSHQPAILPPPAPGPAVPAVAVSLAAPLHWSAWALLVWAAGIVLMAAPLLLGTVLAWRQTRRARPVTGADWSALLADLAGRLGVRRTVSLRRSAGARIPATSGIFRPTIILPAEADAWALERRTVVLLHELAHVKRADCLTQLIARLARALYWFNPLVWLACRMLRIERERACDDLVLSAGHKPSDYAGHLLEIVRTLRSNRCPSLAAVAMAQRSQFEGRLLAILDGHRNRRSLTRWGLLTAVVLLAGIVLPLSLIKAKAADQPAVAARPATQSADDIQQTDANKTGVPTDTGTTVIGTLTAPRLRVPAPVAGTVIQALVQPGDRVAKGDPLVDLQQANGAQAHVTAPQAGAVSEVLVQKNDAVTRGADVVVLLETAKLGAELRVPESLLPRIKTGQSVVFSDVGGHAFPGRVFQGCIERIAPEIDPNTGTGGVWASIVSGDAPLLPGMFVQATVQPGDVAATPVAPAATRPAARRPYRFDLTDETMQNIVFALRRECALPVSFENLDFDQNFDQNKDVITLAEALARLEAREKAGPLTPIQKDRLQLARKQIKDGTSPKSLFDLGQWYSRQITATSADDLLTQVTADTPYTFQRIAGQYVIGPRESGKLAFPVTLKTGGTGGLTLTEALAKVVSQQPKDSGIIIMSMYIGPSGPGYDPMPWLKAKAPALDLKNAPAIEALTRLTAQMTPPLVWELAGMKGNRLFGVTPAPGSPAAFDLLTVDIGATIRAGKAKLTIKPDGSGNFGSGTWEQRGQDGPWREATVKLTVEQLQKLLGALEKSEWLAAKTTNLPEPDDAPVYNFKLDFRGASQNVLVRDRTQTPYTELVTFIDALVRQLRQRGPDPAPPLRGTVTGPDGKPAVGYTVSLRGPGGPALQEKCDDRGVYQFVNIPPGTYELYAETGGKADQPNLRIEEVILRAGQPVVQDLTFAAKFRISGTVTYQDRSPAAGREVALTANSDDGRIEFMNFAVVDAQGRYSLDLPFDAVSYVGLNGTIADGPLPDPQHDVKASSGPVNLVIAQAPPATQPAK